MPEPVFSFIIPTRGRPEGMLRLCDSIRAKTRRIDDLEIVLVVDTDDEPSCHFMYPGLNIHIVPGAKGRTMGELNMAGYRASSGRYLMLLNDDVVIDTWAWDDQVLDVLRTYPDGIVLVHVNEGIFRETLCTFPLLSRTFCELAGGICSEGYLRYRIDDHIHNVFDLLTLLGYRRRVFLPDVVFRHLNLTETTEGHAYVVDPQIHGVDTRRFNGLLTERKQFARALVGIIEQRKQSERRRALDATLATVVDSTEIRDPRHAVWYPATSSPGGRPRVTVGVVSADIRSEHARHCLELLKAHTSNFDLVIADNNRGDEFNHSREMNRLLEFCRTGYLVLMDDDVFVEAGWLEGMMRAMEPGVGVVTPVHKDRHGSLSYAGVVLQPDDSGHHTHVMTIGDRPQPIQTLCSAIMLIDMSRCGHVRLEEVYSKYFLDIDYGLRIWEEGWRVVCSPWSQVTHLGGGTLVQGSDRSSQLYEEQRRHWVSVWAHTRRIHALRRGIWSTVPEFVELSRLKREADHLFFEGTRLSKDALFSRGRTLIESLHAVPALKNYIGSQARGLLQDRVGCADDPETAGATVLLGLAGQPVLYEASPRGMNIVLWNTSFHAIPAHEGAFDPNREYSRSFRATTPQEVRDWVARVPVFDTAIPPSAAVAPPPPLPVGEPIITDLMLTEPISLDPIAPGVEAGLKRLSVSLPYLSSLRPRVLVRRGANLFDPDYYRRTYPDVSDRGVNPLLHFVISGAFEGRNPHPLFDTAFYLRTYPDVEKAKVNPLGHFLKNGARERRQPHPLFDPAFYLEHYPDVRKSGMNPLVHYVLYGAAEGRQPHPWFQPDYYLEHCPERNTAVGNPLIHFLQSDAKHRGAPHAQFDCEYYLRQNPGVAIAGMNPLVHYVLFGARAGRLPSAAFNGSRPNLGRENLAQAASQV